VNQRFYYTVGVTALFNFMNGLVEGVGEGVGIEFNPSYVKLASEPLAKRGYLRLIDMISRSRCNVGLLCSSVVKLYFVASDNEDHTP
jgi:hypothetical protein